MWSAWICDAGGCVSLFELGVIVGNANICRSSYRNRVILGRTTVCGIEICDCFLEHYFESRLFIVCWDYDTECYLRIVNVSSVLVCVVSCIFICGTMMQPVVVPTR